MMAASLSKLVCGSTNGLSDLSPIMQHVSANIDYFSSDAKLSTRDRGVTADRNGHEIWQDFT